MVKNIEDFESEVLRIYKEHEWRGMGDAVDRVLKRAKRTLPKFYYKRFARWVARKEEAVMELEDVW